MNIEDRIKRVLNSKMDAQDKVTMILAEIAADPHFSRLLLDAVASEFRRKENCIRDSRYCAALIRRKLEWFNFSKKYKLDKVGKEFLKDIETQATEIMQKGGKDNE